jgi:hypothetical protein
MLSKTQGMYDVRSSHSNFGNMDVFYSGLFAKPNMSLSSSMARPTVEILCSEFPNLKFRVSTFFVRTAEPAQLHLIPPSPRCITS